MRFDSDGGLRYRPEHLVRWVLIDGNRLLLTGGVIAGFFVLTWSLISSGVLSVGTRSPIESVLGSGVVAGLFSLISVTLTINQLVSARVFGGVNTLQEKFEGGTNLRQTVADITGHPSPPIDAADFISFIGDALQEQVVALEDEYDHRSEGFDNKIASYVVDLGEYSERIQQVSSDRPPERVILTLAGSDLSQYFSRTDDLRSGEYEKLRDAEREILDSIADLLSAIAVFRQYFKTIALHQELAQLSRQFIFVGFPAVVVALLTPLIYRSDPAGLLTSYPLPLIISVSLSIVLTPLVLLMAYILRIATIFRYTVSVAPFVPPAEWSEDLD